MFDLLSGVVDSRSSSANVPVGGGSSMESVETLVPRRIDSPGIQHIETDRMVRLRCSAIRSRFFATDIAVSTSELELEYYTRYIQASTASSKTRRIRMNTTKVYPLLPTHQKAAQGDTQTPATVNANENQAFMAIRPVTHTDSIECNQ